MTDTNTGWRKRQIALDIKAENARELGLDYEPDKTIIEMARESHMDVYGLGKDHDKFVVVLEAFAELVREDERNKTWTPEHWTEYERGIAATEREACAKWYEDKGWLLDESDVAAAIRARGQA